MRKCKWIFVLVAMLLVAGCAEFKATIVTKGQPCSFKGVVVSEKQIVEANEPSPIDGILLGGQIIEDLLKGISGE